MLRGLFNAAATLSLLLCLSLAALALFTIRAPASLQFVHHGTSWRVIASTGVLKLDNQPQRSCELAPAFVINARIAALRKQRMVLDRRSLELRRLLKQSPPHPSDIDEDLLQNAEQTARIAVTIARTYSLLSTVPATPASPLRSWSVSILTLVIATALLPTLRLSLFLFTLSHRRSLTLQNRCPHCSYDLRATPERCPECGHIPADFRVRRSAFNVRRSGKGVGDEDPGLER